MAWEVGADIKVQYSWIQSKIKDGDLKLQKVSRTNNVADAMTKAVDRWALDKYMTAMNCFLMPGRADKASRALSLVHFHERSRLHLDRGMR